MAFDTDNLSKAAFKKLFGKAHTGSPVGEGGTKDLPNESVASLVNVHSKNVYGEDIPLSPPGSSTSVIRVCTAGEEGELDLTEDGSSNGNTYFVTVPAAHDLTNYTNPETGINYVAGERVQNIIPASYGSGYRPIPKDNTVEIPPTDASDWFLDDKSGTLTSETDLDLGATGTIACYVYIGDMVSDVIGDGNHFHDGDTLQLDGINSDGGAFDFITSGALNFKVSGDSDNYIQFITASNIPAIKAIGGKGFDILSDDATEVSLWITEDDTHCGTLGWSKSGDYFILSSTHNMRITTNGDFDDYLDISTAGDQTTLNWAGQNALITADLGTISFGNDHILTTGNLSCAPKATISDSATTAPLNVTERSAEPSSPAAQDVYLDDGTNTASGNPGWRRYTGAAWEDITAASGAGAPPGADTQIIYNDGGSWGAIANFTWDDTDLLVGGTTKIQFSDANSYIWHDGTNLSLRDDTQIDLDVGATLSLRIATGRSTFFVSSGDYTIAFDTVTNNGQFYWDDSADKFVFPDNILMNAGTKIYFRDTDAQIYSSAAGDLNLAGSTEINCEDQLNMNSNQIINVTDPTSDQHAATKKYVDDNAGGNPDIGCRLGNSNPQDIVTATSTAITFNTEIWDTDTMHDVGSNTERVTIKTAGIYILTANVEWESGKTGYRQVQFVHHRGETSLQIAQIRDDASTAVAQKQCITTIYDLEVDDYITLTVRQTQGINREIENVTGRSPIFAVQMIAEN